jgi:hypothetical protein
MFENHIKPTTWDLEQKSDWALLNIVQTKLHNRTRRECEKLDKTSRLKHPILWKKTRSKFYSLWYALEAINIYTERKDKM